MNEKIRNMQVSDSLEDRIRLLFQEIFGDRAIGGASWNGERYDNKKVVFFDSAFGMQRCIWRYRNEGKFSPSHFTLRSMYKKGRDCELWHILRGEFDHYLYVGVSDMRITDWFLIHLAPFRAVVNANPQHFLNAQDEIFNDRFGLKWDGTAFFRFATKDFPPGTITNSMEFHKGWQDNKWAHIYDGARDSFSYAKDGGEIV